MNSKSVPRLILKIHTLLTCLFFLLQFLITYNGILQAQWVQTNGPNGGLVNCLAVSGTSIFAGSDSGVFLSTNNGSNWTNVDLTSNCGIGGVGDLAVNASSIFVGTSGAGVWRRPLSELVGVSKEVNDFPKEFMLSQNYPNPFNPSTVISYSLPSASNVKLIVYNSLGQTVKVIENGFKNAGNYSIKFNAAELPSGIYFYKLETGQFSQVKKMMVIK